MPLPLISVVVCTFNRSKLLSSCLDSLTCQTIDKCLYEVIVVDNKSTDDTFDVAMFYAEKLENFKVIKEERPGKSYALNRGIAESKGKYIAFMDDDAKAYPDWLERIVAAFETVKPEPAAVGGMIIPWYEQTPPEWFTDDLEIRTWGKKRGFLKPPRAQHGFSGSNMVLPKNILDEFDGFKTDFGPVGDRFALGEETELFNRIYKKNSLFWYDPDIRVEHLVPARKISVRYRLERAYMGGISGAARNGNYSFIAMLKAVIYIIVKSCILPFCVSWWKKDWQRSFLKQAQLIAGSTGFLKGLMSGRK